MTNTKNRTANPVWRMALIGFLANVLGVIPLASAADGDWIGLGGGNWEDETNWRDGIIAASGIAYLTNDLSANPAFLINDNYALDALEFYPVKNRSMTIDATYPANSLDQYAFSPLGDSFTAYVAFNCGTEWNVPISGNKPINVNWGGSFLLRCPWNGTGTISRTGGTFEIDHRFALATQDGMVSSNMVASRTINLSSGANLILDGRFPKTEGAGYYVVTPGSPIVELVPTNFTVRSVANAGQTVLSDCFPEGTRIARTFSSASAKSVLSALPLDTVTSVTTQLLTFVAAPRWDVVQDFDLITSSDSQTTITLCPCVSGSGHNQYAAGTNTVTLNVGKITGNANLRTTVNTSYKGKDATLAVDDLSSFRKDLILQSITRLSLKKLADEASTPPVSDPALWMDASAVGTVATDGSGHVTSWTDVRGAAYAEATPWLESPTVMTDELNGRAVIDFGRVGSRQALQWNREITGIKAIFVVLGSQETGGCLLGAKPGCSTSYLRGFNPIDAVGNSAANAATYRLHKANGLVPFNPSGTYRVAINGTAADLSGSGMSGGYDVYTVSLPGLSYKASAFAFDAGNDADGDRLSGGQRLAEVLVYTNALTAAQCQQIEHYLQKKWLDKNRDGYGPGRVNNLTVQGAPSIGARDGTPLLVDNLTGNGTLTLEADTDLTANWIATNQSFSLQDGATLHVHARKVPNAPDLGGTLLWLDAADAGTFTLEGNGNVREWKNKAPNSIGSVTAGPSAPVLPVRTQDANGRWLVDFGGIGNGCALRFATNLWARSLFMVWIQKDFGCQPFGNMKQGYTTTTPGFNGNTFRGNMFSRHNGTTMGSGIVTTWSGKNAKNGNWYKDGSLIQNVTVVSMPQNQLMMNSGILQGGDRISAIGGYDYDDAKSGNWGCSGGFQLAEMILYDKTLTEVERRDVEAYLQRKWFGKIPDGYCDGAFTLSSLTVDGNVSMENTGNAPLAVEHVKGSGTLAVTGNGGFIYAQKDENVTFAGTTYGGVCLFPTEAPAAGESPILHIDATNRNAITFYQSSYVKYYTDLAQGIQLSSTAGVQSWLPKYATGANGCNGKAIIDFDIRSNGNNRDCRSLCWNPPLTNIRTVFWMFRDHPTRGGGFLLGQTNGTSFLRGNYGTKLNDSPLFDDIAADYVKNGSLHVDGISVPYNHVPKQDWQVLSLVTTDNGTANTIAADRGNKDNWGGLQLGELIIYSRAMDDAERINTEAYLMDKWLGKRHPELYRENSGWFIHAAGQTVTNTAGTAHGNIAGLQGDGTVFFRNANASVLGDARNFAGTAHLTGNSVVTLNSSAYAASTWIVDADSVLDLGGKTVVLGGIGGGGTVSNGTLIVSNLIVDGTDARNDLTIKGDLTLADGACVTVLAPERHASRVNVQGRLTLASGDVSVRLLDKLPFDTYPILTYDTLSAGTPLDQWPCVNNLPEDVRYVLRVRPTSSGYTLSGSLEGTIIIFK